jgi:hypothetical protein
MGNPFHTNFLIFVLSCLVDLPNANNLIITNPFNPLDPKPMTCQPTNSLDPKTTHLTYLIKTNPLETMNINLIWPKTNLFDLSNRQPMYYSRQLGRPGSGGLLEIFNLKVLVVGLGSESFNPPTRPELSWLTVLP